MTHLKASSGLIRWYKASIKLNAYLCWRLSLQMPINAQVLLSIFDATSAQVPPLHCITLSLWKGKFHYFIPAKKYLWDRREQGTSSYQCQELSWRRLSPQQQGSCRDTFFLSSGTLHVCCLSNWNKQLRLLFHQFMHITYIQFYLFLRKNNSL